MTSRATVRLGRALVIAMLALACVSDKRTVVTVYTPHGKELLTDLKTRFEREHPLVDIQWLDLGSQEVLERIRAEKANPQADLWFGAPSEMFDRAAKEGLLEAFSPSWASTVPAEARDTAGFWFGTYLTPEVIGYNTQAISESAAPADWDDLALPKWKGKLVIRDPVPSGTMRAIFGAILQRSIAETGNTDRGFDYLRRLDANTREYTASPTILYQKLGRREGVVTLYNMPDLATLQERTKIPVRAVIPRSGTPVLVDAIAIVKGAKHPEEAKAFYNFIASREQMMIAAKDHLRIPARNDIPLDSLPQWIRVAKTQIKPMPLDRQLMADSLNVWMTFWDTHIRNRFRGK